MKRSQCPLLREYSNAERVLATTAFTLLVVNLEIMTSNPYAGGGSKNCDDWKVEKAVHYYAHVDNVTTNSSTN